MEFDYTKSDKAYLELQKSLRQTERMGWVLLGFVIGIIFELLVFLLV